MSDDSVLPSSGRAFVQGRSIPWPDAEITVYAVLFAPLFAALALYTTKQLRLESRAQSRAHVIVLHALIGFMSCLRVFHFLLGPYHTRTLLAKHFSVPYGFVSLLQGMPTTILLGVYCIEMTIFIQLGWAASMQMAKLTRGVNRIRKAGYACCAFTIAIQTRSCL
eukprot:c17540_g1_i3.p2 GENE.c17540_g1_i3~~c17540_g1_i3.p2  ORF type:complete len:165 (+),score=14.71 c17540_g1_i3:154-648(+)